MTLLITRLLLALLTLLPALVNTRPRPTVGSIGHKPEKDPYPKWGGVWAVGKWHELGATAFDCDVQISADGTPWAIHWSDWWRHGIVAKKGTTVPHLPIGKLHDAQIRNLIHKDGWVINTLAEVLAAAAPLGMTVCVEAKSLFSRATWAKIRSDAEKVGCRIVAMRIQTMGGFNAYLTLRNAYLEGVYTVLLGRKPIKFPGWWSILDAVKTYPWPIPKSAKTVRLTYGNKYGASCGPNSARQVTAAIARAGGEVGYVSDVQPAKAPLPKNALQPRAYFIGARGPHITWLSSRLIAHGFNKHHLPGRKYLAGPTFNNLDRENVRDFQLAQGWLGSDADGFPGPTTLALLADDPK